MEFRIAAHETWKMTVDYIVDASTWAEAIQKIKNQSDPDSPYNNDFRIIDTSQDDWECEELVDMTEYR